MARPPAPPRRPDAEQRAKLGSLSERDRRAVEQLAEVEGAIAALEGRDAQMGLDTALARRDQERVRKELQTVASAAARHTAAASRRRLAGRVALGAGAVVVASGLVVLGLRVRDWVATSTAAHAAASSAAAPFLDAGFERVATGRDEPVIVETQRGRCFVAVAASASGPQRVRVERPGGAVEADGSVAWCGCSVARTPITSGGPTGTALAVLAAPAGRLGGADGLPRLTPPPGAVVPEVDDRACVEEAVDELVKSTSVPPAPSALPPAATRLASYGFTSVASGAPGAPFVPLPPDEGTCFVAVTSQGGGPIAIRLPGGARTVGARGVVGLCQGGPSGASVWGDGAAAIAIVSAPLTGVGGTVGLREALDRAGHPEAPIVRTADVLASDARAIVLSGGAAPAHILEGATSLLGKMEPPFLLAFSAADAGSAPRLDPAAVTCSPALGTAPAAALCLGGEGAFDPVDGVRAQRPEWLRIGTDRPSLERGLALMALARRLALQEFELTTVGSFTPTPTGVEVVGRAGEAEVVAVALGGPPPVIHTLSDGPPWSLDGEPRVVGVAPGARVTLTATPAFAPVRWTPSGPVEERRVIVLFRR